MFSIDGGDMWFRQVDPFASDNGSTDSDDMDTRPLLVPPSKPPPAAVASIAVPAPPSRRRRPAAHGATGEGTAQHGPAGAVSTPPEAHPQTDPAAAHAVAGPSVNSTPLEDLLGGDAERRRLGIPTDTWSALQRMAQMRAASAAANGSSTADSNASIDRLTGGAPVAVPPAAIGAGPPPGPTQPAHQAADPVAPAGPASPHSGGAAHSPMSASNASLARPPQQRRRALAGGAPNSSSTADSGSGAVAAPTAPPQRQSRTSRSVPADAAPADRPRPPAAGHSAEPDIDPASMLAMQHVTLYGPFPHRPTSPSLQGISCGVSTARHGSPPRAPTTSSSRSPPSVTCRCAQRRLTRRLPQATPVPPAGPGHHHGASPACWYGLSLSLSLAQTCPRPRSPSPRPRERRRRGGSTAAWPTACGGPPTRPSPRHQLRLRPQTVSGSSSTNWPGCSRSPTSSALPRGNTPTLCVPSPQGSISRSPTRPSQRPSHLLSPPR